MAADPQEQPTAFKNELIEALKFGGHGEFAGDEKAVEHLLLDFLALLYEAIISLEAEIEPEKFAAIRESLYGANHEEFKRVIDKHLDAINAIVWHRFADMTVLQFKSLAFDTLRPRLPYEEVKRDLREMHKDQIPDYLVTKIKEMASQDNLQAIVNLWQKGRLLAQDKSLATVECSVQ